MSIQEVVDAIPRDFRVPQAIQAWRFVLDIAPSEVRCIPRDSVGHRFEVRNGSFTKRTTTWRVAMNVAIGWAKSPAVHLGEMSPL